jgi:UDP-3-O-[3-hydroxymyristoyl] glucosamine N-acyltransferase
MPIESPMIEENALVSIPSGIEISSMVAVNASTGEAVVIGSSVGIRVGTSVGMNVGISVEMSLKTSVGVGVGSAGCGDMSFGVEVGANFAENSEQAEMKIASNKSIVII